MARSLGDDNYPEWLEHYWVHQAEMMLGVEGKYAVCQALRHELQALVDQYTMGSGGRNARRPTERVAEGEGTLMAYGLFYYPRSWFMARTVLNELMVRLEAWPPRKQELQILDLGSGPGPVGLALAMGLAARHGGRYRITAVDKQSAALTHYLKTGELARQQGYDIQLEARQADLAKFLRQTGPGGYDVYVAGLSLNEAFPEEGAYLAAAERLVRAVGDKAVALILEPYLPETARRLEMLRDRLATEVRTRAHLTAPCTHQQRCPLLAEGRFQCHEVRSWRPPPMVEMLNRRLQADIHTVRFCFQVFTGTAVEQSRTCATTSRLVAPVRRVNNVVVTRLCTPTGELVDVGWTHRRLDKKTRKGLLEMPRGSLVVLPIPDDVDRRGFLTRTLPRVIHPETPEKA